MPFKLDIPLPSKIGREELFRLNLNKVLLDEKIDWEELVKRTDGYSGADISNVLIYFFFN